MSITAPIHAVVIPISELLTQVMVQIAETAHAANDVLIEKMSFAQLSSYLRNVSPVFTELESKGVRDTATFRMTLERLAQELKNAKDIVDTCRTKSKFYLFINCRSVMKKLQHVTNEIGRVLSLLPLAQLDLSLTSKEKINSLLQEMQGIVFKTARAAEEVVCKIELGVKDHIESSCFSNDLLMQIEKALGVELNSSLLQQELEQLKKDKETAELQKNRAEALQLEQIAALLSWADVASPLREREQRYHNRRQPLGSHPYPPLQSFFCPITQDVMEDPVEIASGQAFEREAIIKWFADGNFACPVTREELQSLDIKPNGILKRSINEWRERNAMIQLTTVKTKLAGEDEEVLLVTLEELCCMCHQKCIHRHWIAAEGLVPILVNLLKSSKSTVRKKTLATLTVVVEGNLDLKDRACQVGMVALAVRSLAREVSESRQAIALLLEVSKERKLCKLLTRVQGCIILIVTMTKCEVHQAADDACAILENLSKSKEQNAIFMAEAGYFGPLVRHLNEGSNTTQIKMANALSQIQLTDESKRAIVQLRSLPPLVKMLSEGDLEVKASALGALINLSRDPDNGDAMVESGVLKPLLELLFTHNSVLMTMKEQAAIVFANLALASNSMVPDHASDLLKMDPDPNQIIYPLLSLLSFTGPTIQIQLLRALVGMSYPPNAQGLRKSIREARAVEFLVNLYICNTSTDVRLHVLKLLQILTQDGGGETLAKELEVEVIQSLVEVLADSFEEDVKSSVMGLLNNIPKEYNNITELLVEAGLLPVITSILQTATSNIPVKTELLENATGVLLRFTLSSNLPLQRCVVTHGVIPMLLQLLKSGTSVTKCRCALSLGQLSENTWKQTCRVKKVPLFWCITSQLEDVCRVHGGICSVEKSFCLVEAQAIPILIRALVEQEPAVVESTLGALATLVYDEYWDRGADAIADESGVGPMIRLLTFSNTRIQENALWILERIFRKERYRVLYGNTAQMPLITLAQDGTNRSRQHAARILAHLNVLQEQSSYF